MILGCKSVEEKGGRTAWLGFKFYLMFGVFKKGLILDISIDRKKQPPADG